MKLYEAQCTKFLQTKTTIVVFAQVQQLDNSIYKIRVAQAIFT